MSELSFTDENAVTPSRNENARRRLERPDSGGKLGDLYRMWGSTTNLGGRQTDKLESSANFSQLSRHGRFRKSC